MDVLDVLVLLVLDVAVQKDHDVEPTVLLDVVDPFFPLLLLMVDVLLMSITVTAAAI